LDGDEILAIASKNRRFRKELGGSPKFDMTVVPPGKWWNLRLTGIWAGWSPSKNTEQTFANVI
jgi:hypothetical protein